MRPAGRALLPAGPTHLRVLPLRDGALIRETPYDRSMMFTPLHRALGEPAGPITFDMLQHAIKVGVAENDELDWKRNLPEQSKFKDSDFIKDIAAMANSGGGMIIFGVEEKQKKATGWSGSSCVINESYERTIRQAAWSKISPPVLNLTMDTVTGPGGQSAAWLLVPPSDDVPHLEFKKDCFRAPIRNGADTEFLSERQIEAMYRARFDAHSRAEHEMDELCRRTMEGHAADQYAWLVAVGRPTVRSNRPLSREEVVRIMLQAEEHLAALSRHDRPFFFQAVDGSNPRPGYRSWRFLNQMKGDNAPYEAWISIHDDGAVTVAAVIGGGYQGSGWGEPHAFEGHQIRPSQLEEVVAGFASLVRATAAVTERSDYEIRIDVEWEGDELLELLTPDHHFMSSFHSNDDRIRSVVPIHRSVKARCSDDVFLEETRSIALDCVNQGGRPTLIWITDQMK